jgi:Flp pilus assembly pilin Flp
MKTFPFKKFQRDESGAITVDWVVLTGAIVGISFGIIAVIFGFLGAAEAKINGDLANNDLSKYSEIVE